VDGIESGPLSYLVDYDTADAAREWHHLLFNAVLGLVALHLCAVLFYRFVHRNDLVWPMITGRKRFDKPVLQPTFAPWWRALLCLAVAGAVAIWVSAGAPLPGVAS
jgi:phosphoglycerol transferase MdoB-like AlkP superfamily enzyme